MFYNYSVVGYFVLLFVAFVTFFRGLEIIKIRRATLFGLFTSNDHVLEGQAAVHFGVALIMIGVVNFMVLVWLLVG